MYQGETLEGTMIHSKAMKLILRVLKKISPSETLKVAIPPI